MKKKATFEPVNSWSCPNCKGAPDFEHDEMMKHLKEVHGIDLEGIYGDRKLIMHVDGANYFTNQYEWTIKKLKFLQVITRPRRKR